MTIKITQFGDLIPGNVLAAFGGVDNAMDAVIGDVMEGARAKWTDLANHRLNTTRQAYIAGLQPIELQPGRGILTLAGGLPVGIEEGFGEMDLHKTLLGPDVPIAPLGQKGKRPIAGHPGKYYRSIPFRHAAPGSRGATGVPMGRAYGEMLGEKAAKRLGSAVYKAAKALSPTTGVPYGPTQWGGRMAPGGINWGQGVRWKGAPKLKPSHSTDIYAGMVRMEKFYKKGPQSEYMTFRTISDMVPEKWHRKATPGIHLVDEVAKYVEDILPAAFDAFARAFL
jgi:hypothetical protein